LRFSRATLERAAALGALLQIPRRVVEEHLLGNSASFWRAMAEPNTAVPRLDRTEVEAIQAALEDRKADGSLITAIKDGPK